jgi:hypothetical protein
VARANPPRCADSQRESYRKNDEKNYSRNLMKKLADGSHTSEEVEQML